ncbi:hypothetical protein ABEG18_13225 [Alsobacter sp. KACC 23698]|uniref:Uncharacterized protein n=1 Tax=Alsobacter sp. KACC 23698 TaxID=3149229 RepID=A0AAU7J8Z1_9HYPH
MTDAGPARVELPPGWLRRDTTRAAARLEEWAARAAQRSRAMTDDSRATAIRIIAAHFEPGVRMEGPSDLSKRRASDVVDALEEHGLFAVPAPADLNAEALEKALALANWLTELADEMRDSAYNLEQDIVPGEVNAPVYRRTVAKSRADAFKALDAASALRASAARAAADKARIEELTEALKPFAEFIDGTGPLWADERRISTLNYDFDKLTLGIFRRARTALSAHPEEAPYVPAIVDYPDSGHSELVLRDVPVIGGGEMGVTVLRDMHTREIVGFRWRTPRALTPEGTAEAVKDMRADMLGGADD